LRPLITLLVVAVLGATTITALSTPRPLDEHDLDLRIEHALPGIADDLREQPDEVREAFLAFAGDRQLLLNAQLALLRHPLPARRVIPLYVERHAFRLVLREHGPAVIPPIHYFLDHEPATLRLRAQVVSWLSDPGDGHGDRPTVLTPHERGLYAIEFIRREGHDFLGQFVTDDDGRVHWIQSERLATAAKRFLSSGLTELETKRRLGRQTTVDDYGWAAVDLMLPLAAFKAARLGKAGRAARAGSTMTRTARTARLATGASRTARLARFGRTAAKAGAIAGTAYLVLNPGVIGSVGAELARWTGLPPWLVTAGLWFALLAPLLLLLRCLYCWLVRPVGFVVLGVPAGISRFRQRRPDDRFPARRPVSQRPV